jgi:hypothetical protein
MDFSLKLGHDISAVPDLGDSAYHKLKLPGAHEFWHVSFVQNTGLNQSIARPYKYSKARRSNTLFRVQVSTRTYLSQTAFCNCSFFFLPLHISLSLASQLSTTKMSYATPETMNPSSTSATKPSISRWWPIGTSITSLILYAIGGGLFGAATASYENDYDSYAVGNALWYGGVAICVLGAISSLISTILWVMFLRKRQKSVYWNPVTGLLDTRNFANAPKHETGPTPTQFQQPQVGSYTSPLEFSQPPGTFAAAQPRAKNDVEMAVRETRERRRYCGQCGRGIDTAYCPDCGAATGSG